MMVAGGNRRWFLGGCLLALSAAGRPAQAHPWDALRGQLYGLGLAIGAAYAHAYTAAYATDVAMMRGAVADTQKDLFSVQRLDLELGRKGGPRLDHRLFTWADTTFRLTSLNDEMIVEADFYQPVAEVRDNMTAMLAEASPTARNAYVLGANLGIAETMGGERARGFIVTGLTNARAAAQALGLATRPIDQCLAGAAGPLPQLRPRIQAALAAYQALLG